MALSETIQLKDEVSAAADKASSAIENLASSFDGVNKAAESAATAAASATAKAAAGEVKAAQATLKHATSLDEVAAAENKVAKAIGKHMVAQKKLNAIKDKADKDRDKASKKQKGANKDAIFGIKALGTAVAAVGAAVIVAKVIKKTIDWASETVKTKRQLRNMLDILTKGKGDKALQVLTKEAKFLNISVADAASSFKGFRKAGLDNKASIMLLRLKADLEATVGPGEEAAAGVADAMKRIKAGEDAAAVIKDVAKGFGAAGDGSKAAAVKVSTLDGKMKTLGLRWDAFLEKAAVPIGETLLDFGNILLETGDSLNFIGSAISEAFNADPIGFISSAIDVVGSAMLGLPGIVAGAVNDMVNSAISMAGDWATAGSDALAGFVGSFDLVGAVMDIAGNAVSAVKNVFKTGSESKVFKSIGADVSAGFTSGVEKAPPPALPAPLTPPMKADVAGAGGIGNGPVEITINVEGATEPEATALAIRREVVNVFNQMSMSGGF